MKNIFIKTVCCLFIIGCSCPPEKTYHFRFANASGQRVAIVMDEIDDILPDSLVLQPEGSYEWTNMAQDGGFYPLRIKGNGEIKVYFGDSTKIVYSEGQGRSPSRYSNFVLSETSKYLYLGVYTFTVADYEAAIALNQQQ